MGREKQGWREEKEGGREEKEIWREEKEGWREDWGEQDVEQPLLTADSRAVY